MRRFNKWGTNDCEMAGVQQGASRIAGAGKTREGEVKMTFHRQPKICKAHLAQDVRDYVNKCSDDKAELKTLERLSASDLTVLMLAFGDMERRCHREMEAA